MITSHAVDDLGPEDNAGAGHIGTVEFNSSTLYRYATVAVHELAGQLAADTPQAVNAIRTRLCVRHAHGQAEYLCQPYLAGCRAGHAARGSTRQPYRCV